MSVSHDSETIAEGQQVFTACAFIHADFDGTHKLFLAKRSPIKKFLPDVYELPGGHIDYGEDMKIGLAREIAEELGMSVKIGDPFACFTYVNEIKRSHSIEVVYFAQFTSPLEEIKLDPDDHSGCVWVSKDDLHKVYTDRKGEDDEEFKIVRRGFELLEGKSLVF